RVPRPSAARYLRAGDVGRAAFFPDYYLTKPNSAAHQGQRRRQHRLPGACFPSGIHLR
ncbi:unnamed protein product, partial [Phaeothamnion confervicola]